MSGKANLDYGTGNTEIIYNVDFMREATLDGSGNMPLQIGITPRTPKDRYGTMFSSGKTTIIQMPNYHPVTGNNSGQKYNLYVPGSQSKGVLNRLSRFQN